MRVREFEKSDVVEAVRLVTLCPSTPMRCTSRWSGRVGSVWTTRQDPIPLIAERNVLKVSGFLPRF